jgi:hypothetical protein
VRFLLLILSFDLCPYLFSLPSPKRDYDRLLCRVVPDLPSVAAIRFAVKSDAWSLVN